MYILPNAAKVEMYRSFLNERFTSAYLRDSKVLVSLASLLNPVDDSIIPLCLPFLIDPTWLLAQGTKIHDFLFDGDIHMSALMRKELCTIREEAEVDATQYKYSFTKKKSSSLDAYQRSFYHFLCFVLQRYPKRFKEVWGHVLLHKNTSASSADVVEGRRCSFIGAVVMSVLTGTLHVSGDVSALANSDVCIETLLGEYFQCVGCKVYRNSDQVLTNVLLPMPENIGTAATRLMYCLRMWLCMEAKSRNEGYAFVRTHAKGVAFRALAASKANLNVWTDRVKDVKVDVDPYYAANGKCEGVWFEDRVVRWSDLGKASDFLLDRALARFKVIVRDEVSTRVPVEKSDDVFERVCDVLHHPGETFYVHKDFGWVSSKLERCRHTDPAVKAFIDGLRDDVIKNVHLHVDMQGAYIDLVAAAHIRHACSIRPHEYSSHRANIANRVSKDTSFGLRYDVSTRMFYRVLHSSKACRRQLMGTIRPLDQRQATTELAVGFVFGLSMADIFTTSVTYLASMEVVYKSVHVPHCRALRQAGVVAVNHCLYLLESRKADDKLFEVCVRVCVRV